MRHRRIKNPEPVLATVPCPRPAPGREPLTFAEEVLGAGVPPELLPAVEAAFVRCALEMMQQRQERWAHRLLVALGRSPAGMAVRRALVGESFGTVAENARALGCDPANLVRAETRVRRRLAKNGLVRSQ